MYTKYKISEIAEIYNGSTPSTTEDGNYDGDIIWITPKDLADQQTKYIHKGERNITKKGFDSCSTHMIPAFNILMSSRAPIGLFAINKVECCTNQGFKNLIVDKSKVNVDYLYYYLKYHVKQIEALGSGTTFKEVPKVSLEKYEIFIPELDEQNKIAEILSLYDNKIENLNKQTTTLKELIKSMFNYWFIQFDYPNNNNLTYKTAGGELEYSDILKFKIPKDWKIKKISDLIAEEISGDWGESEPKKNNINEVSCIRGCDMTKLDSLPKRYILKKNSNKYLHNGDFIIEISGGSPTQSTGRIIHISEEILNRFDTPVICSNFCHGFRLKDSLYNYYFENMWNTFNEQGIFFNYEGKTSGLKNFQFDTFIRNYWYFPDETILSKFNDIIKPYYQLIDRNNSEIIILEKQREKYLALFMNEQITIKSL